MWWSSTFLDITLTLIAVCVLLGIWLIGQSR